MKDFIVDQETGKNVAFIKDGEVFKDAHGTPKIGITRVGNIHDLAGKLVGHIEGSDVTELRTSSMPVSFKRLLEDE